MVAIYSGQFGCGYILLILGKRFRNQNLIEREGAQKRFGCLSVGLAFYVGVVALIAVKIALDVAGIQHFSNEPLDLYDARNRYAHDHLSHKSACHLSDQATHGRELAVFCLSCHSIGSEGSPIGPNLQNVYMSRAGTVPTMPDWNKPLPPYVAAKQAGVVWTESDLFEYLDFPDEYLVKKTGKRFENSYHMPFYVADPKDRLDIIAYLKVISGRPECD